MVMQVPGNQGRKAPSIVASYDPPSTKRIALPAPKSSPSNGTSLGPGPVEIRPCFTSAWVEQVDEAQFELLRRYDVSGVPVRLMASRDSSLGMYALDPPEYRLNPRHLKAVSESISELVDRMPIDIDIASLDIIRPYINAMAKDLLHSRLAQQAESAGGSQELESNVDRFAEILCKYTAGYGLLETLLHDDLVQDIYVDSPSSQTPVQVVLRSEVQESVRQKCRTNIVLGMRDLRSIVSRVKFETGLPFSEANPVLEADLPKLDCRITIVGPPLSDKGIAIAIRKHAKRVWTMPGLISNGTISPLLSSFLWACALGRRTVLIAGSRGSGKTTLLGALMLEFPLAQRIVLLEDTPEVPVRRMQELGFDIQSLRFNNGDIRQNVSADDALRVSLRMGESAIVVGEVRGREARVLYESMRAGSAGSTVLGTIHGNSARGVLDRAVEDLGVSERAFSATDLIVVMGLFRTPDGSRFQRRVSEVAEVVYDGSATRVLHLFSDEGGGNCARPTEHFSSDCRSIRSIARSLGCTAERAMETVKARAYADQLLSEMTDLDLRDRSREEHRLRSNEVLTDALFSEASPEAGIVTWREWLEREDGCHRTA